jgi:hypothetical protein
MVVKMVVPTLGSLLTIIAVPEGMERKRRG